MTTKRAKRSVSGRLLPIAIALLILGTVAHVYGVDIDGVVSDGEHTGRLSLAGGDYILSWTVTGDTAYFGIEARTQGWVALGIGPTQAMAEADMIFSWIDDGGTAGALDCYSTGLFGPHPPDEKLGGRGDILSFAGREQGGVSTIEFSRLLETGDAYDKTLPRDGEVKFIWAYSNSDDYRDLHSHKGSAMINLAGGVQTPETAAAGQVDIYGLLYRVHGALMSSAFGLLLVGMFFPRYLKKRKWWLKVHRRIGISGSVIGLVGIGIAVYMIARTSGVHLRVIHSWIGLATIVLSIFTPFLGHFMLKIRKVPSRAKKARAVHRVIGRITLLFMTATIILGLFQAGIL